MLSPTSHLPHSLTHLQQLISSFLSLYMPFLHLIIYFYKLHKHISSLCKHNNQQIQNIIFKTTYISISAYPTPAATFHIYNRHNIPYSKDLKKIKRKQKRIHHTDHTIIEETPTNQCLLPLQSSTILLYNIYNKV